MLGHVWGVRVSGAVASMAVLWALYFRFAGSYVRVIDRAEFREPSGKVLAGFFDGLPKDPRYDLKSIKAQAAKVTQPACRSGSPGFWSRMLDKLSVVGVVRAQGGNCTATQCTVEYGYTMVDPPPSCTFNAGCGTSTYQNINTSPGSPLGWQVLGPGCTGGTQCPCNQATCVPSCTNSSTCPSGQVCNAGQCVAACTGSSCSPRICQSNGLCGPCTDNSQCPLDAPVCSTSTGNCGPCYGDSDCTFGYLICCEGACLGVLGSSESPCTANCQCESGYCAGGYCTGSGGGGGGGGGCTGLDGECTNDSDCCEGLGCDGSGQCASLDPITVDLSGMGYMLTSVENGVRFDFFGTGKPIQMAWTAKSWNGGFLALDRNGNGKIDNGTELFGNVTPQPKLPSGRGNGFLALAVYDLPANGGNGDGIIDARDAIFSKLVIWVDANHNGITDPGELLSMKQANIQSIALKYETNSWTDMYGNKFRYRSSLMRSPPILPPQQWVYDVLLTLAH